MLKKSEIKEFFKPTIAKISLTILITILAVFSFGFTYACGEAIGLSGADYIFCYIASLFFYISGLGYWVGYFIETIAFVPLNIETWVYIIGNFPWAYLLSCTLVFLYKRKLKIFT